MRWARPWPLVVAVIVACALTGRSSGGSIDGGYTGTLRFGQFSVCDGVPGLTLLPAVRPFVFGSLFEDVAELRVSLLHLALFRERVAMAIGHCRAPTAVEFGPASAPLAG